jgi:hypothetical protein
LVREVEKLIGKQKVKIKSWLMSLLVALQREKRNDKLFYGLIENFTGPLKIQG